MGNLCAILSPPPKPAAKQPANTFPDPPPLSISSNRWSRMRSSRREKPGESLTPEQALEVAAAALYQKRPLDSSLPFDRSTSLRQPAPGKKNRNALPRSSSSRPRSLTDPLLQPHQLVNQDIKLDDLETNHFVLVHGGGFGAWCWYKTIALLEEAGYRATAIDLTGSGIHSFDPNSVVNLAQYVQPLTDFLEKLPDDEKVILVGHDFGGACISYEMELFPLKIAKAIFIAAAMLSDGQNTLDMFSLQAGSDDVMRQAQVFVYANGNGKTPTAIELKKPLLKDLFFNQTPTKDVALASVSMRPIPFPPVLEKLHLSDAKYRSVRRFYIQTLNDNAVPAPIQASLITRNPPEQVFSLKGADHSPFFSKPQALHRLLVEISRIKRS